MHPPALHRWELLEKCLALGTLTLSAPLGLGDVASASCKARAPEAAAGLDPIHPLC